MLLISRRDKDKLENLGLLKHKRTGINYQDANFQVANREHPGRSKTYYVVENKEILTALGKFEMCDNLQKITKDQLNQLKSASLISEEEIQYDGEYVHKAAAYVAENGDVYIHKVAKFLLFLGIWKNGKSKKNS